MTRVDNIKTYKGKNGVRIDRDTDWGNPFRMKGKDSAARALACQKFRRWWYQNKQKPLRKRARRELKDKVLLCHCHPLPCHGLTIATYIEMMKKKKEKK